MNLRLIEMDEKEFEQFKSYLIESYAKDMIDTGFWDKNEAVKRAIEETERLLPDGIKTKSHKLMSIYDQDKKIGYLWFEIRQKNDAYIWDFLIFKEYRGKGYGKESLKLLERYCKNYNVSKISLNVFGNNEIAINLYKKSGYRVIAMTMAKDL